jgi:ParB family transcriptional regulator, chromosome partitioning protein
MPRKASPTPPVDDLAHTLERVALADLRPHPRNYHEHPEAELAHLMHSLTTHGLYRNPVIARDGTILAGHGVVTAAQRVGYTHLSVKRLDLDPHEPRALQIVVGDNEIARLAITHEDQLAALLQDLCEDDPLALLGTGFDEKALEALVQQQTVPDFQPVGIDEQGRLDEKQPLECPACGHTWTP